jgi:hypothetical protein
VLAALQDGRNHEAVLELASGAAGRRDPRFRAAWQADLAREDWRRDLAFVALAREGSREAVEILVSWFASEEGRRFLAGFGAAGAELPGDGGIRAGFLGSEDSVWVDEPTDPLGKAVFRTVFELSTSVPKDLAVRLIAEADADRFPVVLDAWIDRFAPGPEAERAAIPVAVRIAERILGSRCGKGEPACAALQLLGRVDPALLRAHLAEASDRALVACARQAIWLGDVGLLGRLADIARGGDPVLARHAEAALRRVDPEAAAASSGEDLLGRAGDAAHAAALRTRFGEDPFAPVRGR